MLLSIFWTPSNPAKYHKDGSEYVWKMLVLNLHVMHTIQIPAFVGRNIYIEYSRNYKKIQNSDCAWSHVRLPACNIMWRGTV